MYLSEEISKQDVPLNASFAAYCDQRDVLYAVHETSSLPNHGIAQGGAVSVWSKHQQADHLTWKMNQILPSGGNDPTHIALDSKRGLVWISNYSGSSICVYQIEDDVEKKGALKSTPLYQEHYGKGSQVDKERQEESHPHGTFLAGDMAMVVDLGQDCIHLYRAKEASSGSSDVAAIGKCHIGAGYGPRHLEFDARNDLLYVLNELKPTICVMSIDRQKGEVKKLSEVPLEVSHAQAGVRQYASGIVLSSDSRFLYVSNRGNGAILVFQVLDQEAEEGCALKRIQCRELSGTWPRFFCILPREELLVAADQFRGELEVFRIDRSSGLLSKHGSIIRTANAPSCIVPVE